MVIKRINGLSMRTDGPNRNEYKQPKD